MKPNVRYIDRAAITAALADEHQRKRINWGEVVGWTALISLVLSFWWWALFC